MNISYKILTAILKNESKDFIRYFVITEEESIKRGKSTIVEFMAYKKGLKVCHKRVDHDYCALNRILNKLKCYKVLKKYCSIYSECGFKSFDLSKGVVLAEYPQKQNLSVIK